VRGWAERIVVGWQNAPIEREQEYTQAKWSKSVGRHRLHGRRNEETVHVEMWNEEKKVAAISKSKVTGSTNRWFHIPPNTPVSG